MLCRICQSSAEPFDRARVLRRLDVAYFRCVHCGFIQTEEPYWLPEAYAEPITLTDVGYLQRNLGASRITRAVISCLFPHSSTYVDYGGGYGMFVRLMRDAGFSFHRQDAYCPNLFSRSFEADPGARYDLLTAWEVFEHLPDPPAELEKMLGFSRRILFGTQLLPEPAPRIADWPYYSPHHGQHVAFYTRKALGLLAARHGLNLASNGRNLHLFTPEKVSSLAFLPLCRQKVCAVVNFFRRRRSLMDADVRQLLGPDDDA